MRAGWGGFALGVIVLQQQAGLPAWRGWLVLLLTMSGALAGAVWGLRGAPGWRVRAGWCAVWLAAACAGFGYAAWRAELRLASSLPAAWEGRDLDVQGAVRGLPNRDDKGVRFQFEVDSTDSPIQHFPRTIQLAWIDQKGPPPPLLEPGSRWRLTVRLKRAHGNANYGVRDAEAGLFARNIRATGYVSKPETARRLPGFASGLAISVDRWRAALRARIDSVLAGAPHRGVVVALAVGAQDEVSATDWTLMRATGTSHLVAISGLHLGFVAGLAGWLAGALWRRSCFVGRNWPLKIPAQTVAVTCGGAVCGAACGACRFQCSGAAGIVDGRCGGARVCRRAQRGAVVGAGLGVGPRAVARSVGGGVRWVLAVVLRRGGNRLCDVGTAAGS